MSTTTVAHHDEHADHPTGIMRWLTTTNHKDIGTMYLTFSLIMFLVGGAMILGIRAELFQPGLQLMRPDFYNQLIGVHALIMIFAALMPAATGFANWMIPLQIGAPDMALPRLNNWGFWLLPPSAILLTLPFTLALFGIGDGALATGWTFYPPLSVQGGFGVDFAIFAVHLLGISSVLGSINIIVTLFNMRAPGMTLMKMPMFAWGWLITAFLLIATIPVLAGAVTMLLTDRHFGTHFFDAAGGGDPILFQHLFWFFGHPEVYILLLPVWGSFHKFCKHSLANPCMATKLKSTHCGRLVRLPLLFGHTTSSLLAYLYLRCFTSCTVPWRFHCHWPFCSSAGLKPCGVAL